MKRSPRRIPTKPKSCAVLVYFPEELIRLLEAASIKTESERNKFICRAIEEKLKTIGL
jgi:hypothetical protein